ncbi:MAG: arginine deiminase-related protein [Bradyrhizobium sp.]|nr:arginine deiminase-related protein [Bradyrhizobium sp.]
MTDPAHFEVRYAINPWMRPQDWAHKHRRAALRAWHELKQAVETAGAHVTVIDAAPEWPDMVFAANLAVVFDGRCVPARFRHPERQGEEAHFRAALASLTSRGLVDEIVSLPPGLVQEGAGDFIWDGSRQIFWAGYGPRSNKAAALWMGHAFDAEVVPLELATPRFYHLDTCFCSLSGGEVLYYPPAFTEASLHAIRERVAPAALIAADAEAAAGFCVNAVNLGGTIVMAKAPTGLRTELAGFGYRVVEVDLAPYILSGGAAFCLTLRLDNAPARVAVPAVALQGASP